MLDDADRMLITHNLIILRVNEKSRNATLKRYLLKIYIKWIKLSTQIFFFKNVND